MFRNDPDDTKAGCWVHNQRAAKKLNRPIMAERGKRLDTLGFIWGFVDPFRGITC